MDLLHGPRHDKPVRSSNGCWTCRLRRKKCDERHPVCSTCATLHITCHYDQDKPEWMDGGAKQEEMAERLKSEVKEKAAYRPRGERPIHGITSDRASNPQPTSITDELIADPTCDFFEATPGVYNDGRELCPGRLSTSRQRGADCTLTSKGSRERIAFGRSETVLLMFYLEHVLLFLFPFYSPSMLEGGRAWILEIMISSPVVRQATLCQSSYFFSLVQGTVNGDMDWETVLTQTRDAFEVLRQSLQVIDGSSISEHLHGAVRIMASIMQVQRFEIAVLSFNNCQAHLNAALALFNQLLDNSGALGPAATSSRFNAVISRLGPSTWILPARCVQVPSAEQAAFRFSCSLLILDDIIASTALQEQPRLYKYHQSLLSDDDGTGPPINLEAVVGCQNWALLQIGEIAALDAWKQQCRRAGILDVMELVHRATAIKNMLETRLSRLETEPISVAEGGSSLLDLFTVDRQQQSKPPTSQSSVTTRVWAHAAFIYLFVVVSGWQPVSFDVRYHVSRIIELLTCQISPPALLRTMAWPFCVAGCLAEPVQETQLRGMVEVLQPPSVFGTVHKALEVMENVWRSRDAEDASTRDLAMCLRSQGGMVLLV